MKFINYSTDRSDLEASYVVRLPYSNLASSADSSPSRSPKHRVPWYVRLNSTSAYYDRTTGGY